MSIAGFKNLVGWLETGHNVPPATFVAKLPRQNSLEGKDHLTTLPNDAAGVSLTIDLWMSIRSQRYLTITCHYIDCFWNLRSCVLATRYFPEQHTTDNVAMKIGSSVIQFIIVEKELCIDYDQASNMHAAVRELCKSAARVLAN